MSSALPAELTELTEAQKAFLVCLTDQRVANILEAADDWFDLRPEAKDLLRNAKPETLEWLERASKDDIELLKYSISFISASRLLGKVGWFISAMLFGIAVGVLTLWDRVKTMIVAK
ncbi:hypothetical protein [Rhodopseudomonas pseudopalustris]|uniref:Uncharacterized protein n=1 Tax=Rhodopseudomonas pseudopalustris TaxID=1513892 RepID=A0A1H8WIA2_9BRAD|nr:hypothetical protein [Rhodopseudomonas pseudopalustris]SEP27395.1 hypothetical protein SAMN05444123_112120 [Rhodopseudomonas pseudopalustris]